ncbi:MAG: hypothetical protein U0931_07825 [Vulcanimicrobiota bacterium]
MVHSTTSKPAVHTPTSTRSSNESKAPLKPEEKKPAPGQRDRVEISTHSEPDHGIGGLLGALGGTLGAQQPLPVNPKSPGQPAVDQVVAAVRRDGDLKQLNQLDNFRSRLDPLGQAEYDRELAKLSSDERVNFAYKDGARPDPALEGLALRGITAANYKNPKLLNQVLAQSVKADGKFTIDVYPEAVPLDNYNKEWKGTSAGLATPKNDVAIDQKDFYTFLAGGDNALVHEFAHLQQRVGRDGGVQDGRVPGEFPFPNEFAKAFSEQNFQNFLVKRFNPNKADDGSVLGGAESWPTVQNLFRQDPQALKQASPELYRQMQAYTGLDLAGFKASQRLTTPPVVGAQNAHLTNTQEQFQEALKGKAQWFEGDIRPEINHPERLEMRHDLGQEPGNNLSLEEWLKRGTASGRGLKLDLTKLDFQREPERFQQVLAALDKAQTPGDRLMFNFRFEDSQRFGAQVWQRFPEAVLAINPPGGDLLSTGSRLTGLAQHLRDQSGLEAGRVNFVLNEASLALDAQQQLRRPDKISDFVNQLRQEGNVSLWNQPGAAYSAYQPIPEREARWRSLGVDGVIDLRPYQAS